MVEFLTGCEATFALKGVYREWGRLESFMQNQHERRMRPGLRLPLPPDWSKDGYYMTKVTGDGILVAHRFQNITLLWPVQSFPPDLDLSSVVVQGNFSEKSASLIQPGCAKFGPISLYADFAKVLRAPDSDPQQGSRPHSAIKDGAAAWASGACSTRSLPALPAPVGPQQSPSQASAASDAMCLYSTPPLKRRLAECEFGSPCEAAPVAWTPMGVAGESLAATPVEAASAKKSRIEAVVAQAAALVPPTPPPSQVFDESTIVPPPPQSDGQWRACRHWVAAASSGLGRGLASVVRAALRVANGSRGVDSFAERSCGLVGLRFQIGVCRNVCVRTPPRGTGVSTRVQNGLCVVGSGRCARRPVVGAVCAGGCGLAVAATAIHGSGVSASPASVP